MIADDLRFIKSIKKYCFLTVAAADLTIGRCFFNMVVLNNEFKIIKKSVVTFNYFRIFNRWQQ